MQMMIRVVMAATPVLALPKQLQLHLYKLALTKQLQYETHHINVLILKKYTSQYEYPYKKTPVLV